MEGMTKSAQALSTFRYTLLYFSLCTAYYNYIVRMLYKK